MNSRGWKRPDPFPGFLNEGEADTRRRAESKIGGEERERERGCGGIKSRYEEKWKSA